jgi:RNA polymerase sigma-70 factor (ECF subfamily)
MYAPQESVKNSELVCSEQVESGEGLLEVVDEVNTPEVAAWLRGAKEGDEESSRSLIGYLQPFVMKIVCSRQARQHYREDLAQEIIIKAFRKLHLYSEKVPIERWVARIAVNRCTDAYRRTKLRPEYGMADLSEKEADFIETVTSSANDSFPSVSVELGDLIKKLLDHLGPDDRRMMDMICLSGYSYAEVCEEMGWNLSRTKVRLFRARKKLKEYFKELSNVTNIEDAQAARVAA